MTASSVILADRPTAAHCRQRDDPPPPPPPRVPALRAAGKQHHLVGNQCCYRGFQPLNAFAVRVHTHHMGQAVTMTRTNASGKGEPPPPPLRRRRHRRSPQPHPACMCGCLPRSGLGLTGAWRLVNAHERRPDPPLSRRGRGLPPLQALSAWCWVTPSCPRASTPWPSTRPSGQATSCRHVQGDCRRPDPLPAPRPCPPTLPRPSAAPASPLPAHLPDRLLGCLLVARRSPVTLTPPRW